MKAKKEKEKTKALNLPTVEHQPCGHRAAGNGWAGSRDGLSPWRSLRRSLKVLIGV